MFKRLTKKEDENYNSDDYDIDDYSFKEHHEHLICVCCENDYYIYLHAETEHEIIPSLKNTKTSCCNFCCLNKKHSEDDVFYDCDDKKSNLYLFQKEFLIDRLGFYSIVDLKKKKKNNIKELIKKNIK